MSPVEVSSYRDRFSRKMAEVDESVGLHPFSIRRNYSVARKALAERVDRLLRRPTEKQHIVKQKLDAEYQVLEDLHERSRVRYAPGAHTQRVIHS